MCVVLRACVHGCACICTQANMHMCVHKSAKVKSWCWCLPLLLSTLVFLDRLSHCDQSSPIWLDWLFIEFQGSSYLCLPNARIRTVYTVVSGFSSFLKTWMLMISKHKSSGCVASILLIVTSLLWFLPMLINLAGSLLWFLPTTIHSVCSWTSHKWNQTIYTFICDFPIHRFLPLIHGAACIRRLWLFLSKW